MISTEISRADSPRKAHSPSSTASEKARRLGSDCSCSIPSSSALASKHCGGRTHAPFILPSRCAGISYPTSSAFIVFRTLSLALIVPIHLGPPVFIASFLIKWIFAISSSHYNWSFWRDPSVLSVALLYSRGPLPSFRYRFNGSP